MIRRILLGSIVLASLIGPGCDNSGSTGTSKAPPNSEESPAAKSAGGGSAPDRPAETGR